MGRKDLPLAPDRRLGVEMTLLRALAFHPQATIAEPVARPSRRRRPRGLPRQPPQTKAAPAVAAQPQMAPPMDESPPPADDYPDMAPAPDNLPDATSQLLQARTQLLRQGAGKKKSEPAARSARPANPALERLASVTERVQQRASEPAVKAPAKPEAYRWKAQQQEEIKPEPVATPKTCVLRWSMRKRQSWRSNWRKRRCSAMLGGGNRRADAAEAGPAGRAERVERGE